MAGYMLFLMNGSRAAKRVKNVSGQQQLLSYAMNVFWEPLAGVLPVVQAYAEKSLLPLLVLLLLPLLLILTNHCY